MFNTANTDNHFKVSRLASNDSVPSWSLFMFAYNEAETIELALDSVIASAGDNDISVYVLANGCTDSTVEKVHSCANRVKNLWLIETDIADKANAWNIFVHDLLTTVQLKSIQTCFFMDGDVTLSADTFSLMNSALEEFPRAEAVGAMPATGRDRDAWRQRMAINGMLAGNCYALRSDFVQYIREREVRMPLGLIGEDFFVSWLVATNVWRDNRLENEGLRCIFHSKAEFSFRSLSPWHLSDCRTYVRRTWRYALREIQHPMAIQLIMRNGLSALPDKVEKLYSLFPIPPLLVWCGKFKTPIRMLVVLWVRKQRKKNR